MGLKIGSTNFEDILLLGHNIARVGSELTTSNGRRIKRSTYVDDGFLKRDLVFMYFENILI